MDSVSNRFRILSAAMAAICSLGLLGAVGQQLNPSLLAFAPHLVELERVVVTAPAQPALAAGVAAKTAAN